MYNGKVNGELGWMSEGVNEVNAMQVRNAEVYQLRLHVN